MLVNIENNALALAYQYEPSDFVKQNLYSVIEVCSYTTNKHNLIKVDKDTYNNDEIIIMYVFQGQGLIALNDRTYGVKTHDICILSNDNQILISNNNWGVNYIIVKGLGFKNTLLNIADGNEVLHLNNRKKIHFILDQIHNHFFDTKKNDIHLSNVLGSLLDYLNDEFHLVIQDVDDNITKAIVDSLNYIEQNFSKNIKITDIADHYGFNLHYFTRKFSKKIKISPYQYLLNRRLDHAKYMLVTTSSKISEISQVCGFQNETNFYYLFKKKVHMTPKEYRKNII